MNRLCSILVASVIWTGAPLEVLEEQPWSVPSGEQLSRFQVSVDMVSLSVTVFDENRKLVTDLEKADFLVFEDGVEQEIGVFSRESLPLRMVILLDTSSSMQIRMALAQEAAIRFVRSLGSEDQVKVVEFSDRVLTLSDFTSDFDLVAAAVRQTTPGGATSLYNAIYISLRELLKPRADDERQAMIVLSDGTDTRSLVSFEDVRELARQADVLIYTISLRSSPRDLEKPKYANAKYELQRLAEETGGSAYAPEEIQDLAGVYDQIAAELKSQYNIGYVPNNATRGGKWRRIQLRCKREGVDIKARHGYYGPK